MACIEDSKKFGLSSHLDKKTNRFRTHFNGKYYTTYRLIWERFKGKIPKGLQLNHTCNNPKCLNIDHLYMGNQYQNMQDRVENNKTNKGKKWKAKITYFKKLSPIIYEEIRNKYFIEKGYTQRFLASEYNVSQVLIHNILSKK